MSRKKKKKFNKKKKINKNNVPKIIENEKKEELALVVVNKKKLEIDIVRKKEFVKKVIKNVSLALVGTISIVYIIGMIFIGTSVFYFSHLKNGLIQRGVYVNGINLSDLTEEEALNSLNANLNDIPEFIILKYKENEYKISFNELDLKYDINTAIQDAYDIGRTKNVVKDLYDYADTLRNTVNISVTLQYNNEIFNQKLLEIADALPDKVQEYNYEINDERLIINKGKSGVKLDIEKTKNDIIENLKIKKYNQEILIENVLPNKIDLEKIHSSIYTEPKDAYYTENPLTVQKEIVGVDFDINVAKNIIDSNSDMEKYEIPLLITNPSITVKDLNVFPDVLSTFYTKYSNNPNRTTNLIIASNKINGKVLMPGEIFSYNKTVGERTALAGYKNAAIFVNGLVEDGLAGGICQVSSTLYDAAIEANLEIVERHNHSKLTSYLPGGKDATVVWKRYDFQFKNTREYPIKIEMKVENGIITSSIYGIKSNEEYEINIESQRVGVQGAYSVYNAYKVYYQNGIEIKREFLSRDLYK